MKESLGDDLAPLEIVARTMHHHLLSPEDLHNCKMGVETWSHTGSDEILLGARFGGSHIIQKVYDCFFGSLNVALDSKYSVKCMYVSEKDDAARGFIEQEFPEITLIVKTTVELAAREARDVRSGRMLPVPYVDVLVFGFSCISRSTNSKNSKLMLGCIQAGQGDTGETWEQAEQVIKTHRPRKLFAENVKGINQKTPLSEFASDSEYIKVTLGKLGYWSATHMCLAEHFGSETCRYRWMLEGEEGLVKCFHRIIYTEQLLNKLRVDELAFESFVEAVAGKNQSARDSAKRKKLDGGFLEFHAMEYAKRGYKWPAPPNEIEEVFGSALADVPPRSAEVALLCARAFPIAESIVAKMKATPNFKKTANWMDLNCSLEWLCGDAVDKDPWAPHVMTITTKMILLARFVEVEKGFGGNDDRVKVFYKVIDGVELLQLQGWDRRFYRDPSKLPNNELATSLAGNCFNGFMFMGFFTATACSSGASYETLAAEKKPEGGL